MDSVRYISQVLCGNRKGQWPVLRETGHVIMRWYYYLDLQRPVVFLTASVAQRVQHLQKKSEVWVYHFCGVFGKPMTLPSSVLEPKWRQDIQLTASVTSNSMILLVLLSSYESPLTFRNGGPTILQMLNSSCHHLQVKRLGIMGVQTMTTGGKPFPNLLKLMHGRI